MYDVIVIGAGPSGLMASVVASSKGNNVLLIEKNDEVGKKLLLTGGTRCNLTNLKNINDFIKEIPVNNKVLYSALNQFGPHDIYNYFTHLGVPLKIEDNDRVFPVTNKAKTIIDTLYNELINNKVNIHLNEIVNSIDIVDDYKLVTTNKDKYRAKQIIISTGGCSYPKTGSTGDGYKFAKTLNQKVTKLYPAETYVITKDILPLAGITLDKAIIKFNNKEVDGSMLFTHSGLSGPAIFKISEEIYKKLETTEYVTIVIDLLVDYTIDQLLIKLNKYESKKEIVSFIRELIPKRLADYIVETYKFNNKICTISKVKKLKLLHILKEFKVYIKATGTIDESFVTGGGIDVKYINSKTMESTVNKGIYFVGEILDIHGHTGGYNITIALSTGYAAGLAISKNSRS